MRHKILVFLFLAALLLAQGESLASGQFTPDKDVLRATLKNGLRVVIVRDPIAPVVTTVVNYRVGSDEAPAGFPGMAHALEHMMFRGNPGLSADQLAQISAAMGGNFDADTQQTITQYFFTVPADDLEPALHVESLRMSGILATDELWNKERGAIEQEVAQDLSNPEYVLYTKLLDAMFKGTPYEHDALGTRPSFDKTTGAMLKNFYDTLVRAEQRDPDHRRRRGTAIGAGHRATLFREYSGQEAATSSHGRVAIRETGQPSYDQRPGVWARRHHVSRARYRQPRLRGGAGSRGRAGQPSR